MKQAYKMPVNLPNLLTVARILMVPVFAWRYLTAQQPGQYLAAAAILLVSGVTDVLDGIIARSTGSITQWGMAMDPVADKLTQCTAVACLWVRCPALWPIFVLLLLKEVLMVAGGLRLYRRFELVNGSSWFGKLATVVFYVMMFNIIRTGQQDSRALLPSLGVVLAVMLFAWAMYALRYIATSREQRRRRQAGRD